MSEIRQVPSSVNTSMATTVVCSGNCQVRSMGKKLVTNLEEGCKAWGLLHQQVVGTQLCLRPSMAQAVEKRMHQVIEVC